jgi:hypothetical protein
METLTTLLADDEILGIAEAAAQQTQVHPCHVPRHEKGRHRLQPILPNREGRKWFELLRLVQS